VVGDVLLPNMLNLLTLIVSPSSSGDEVEKNFLKPYCLIHLYSVLSHGLLRNITRSITTTDMEEVC